MVPRWICRNVSVSRYDGSDRGCHVESPGLPKPARLILLHDQARVTMEKGNNGVEHHGQRKGGEKLLPV